ncbi:MAG: hypothetical protein IT379_41920 [Deltaproteobacteria bacterium]|nr:hypothetical protein [Deltaproteobacteria bacterium]
MDPELEALVREFTGRLQDHFRKQMMAIVREFVGVVGSAAPSTSTPSARKAPTKAAPAARAGVRRSDAEIAKAVNRVRDYVAAHPGSRMEHIGAGLRLPTKDLTGPVAKLLAAGTIRREGEKRATKYFPGGSAVPAATKARSKTAKAKTEAGA